MEKALDERTAVVAILVTRVSESPVAEFRLVRRREDLDHGVRREFGRKMWLFQFLTVNLAPFLSWKVFVPSSKYTRPCLLASPPHHSSRIWLKSWS